MTMGDRPSADRQPADRPPAGRAAEWAGLLAAFLAGAVLSGCSPESVTVDWSVSVTCEAQRGAVARVDAIIWEGGCNSDFSTAAWQVESDETIPNAGVELPSGRYGFAATARDDGNEELASGCAVIELDEEPATVVTELEPVARCEAPMPSAGASARVEHSIVPVFEVPGSTTTPIDVPAATVRFTPATEDELWVVWVNAHVTSRGSGWGAHFNYAIDGVAVEMESDFVARTGSTQQHLGFVRGKSLHEVTVSVANDAEGDAQIRDLRVIAHPLPAGTEPRFSDTPLCEVNRVDGDADGQVDGEVDASGCAIPETTGDPALADEVLWTELAALDVCPAPPGRYLVVASAIVSEGAAEQNAAMRVRLGDGGPIVPNPVSDPPNLYAYVGTNRGLRQSSLLARVVEVDCDSSAGAPDSFRIIMEAAAVSSGALLLEPRLLAFRVDALPEFASATDLETTSVDPPGPRTLSRLTIPSAEVRRVVLVLQGIMASHTSAEFDSGQRVLFTSGATEMDIVHRVPRSGPSYRQTYNRLQILDTSDARTFENAAGPLDPAYAIDARESYIYALGLAPDSS